MMIPYVDKIDEALCKMNEQYLDIFWSKEYQKGVKLSKFQYALKHRDFAALFKAREHQKINKKILKYNSHNEGFLTYDETIRTSSRIVVYTCITGNYDKPIEPVYQPRNIDYVIITDSEVEPTSRWKKIDINSVEEIRNYDNTRKARYAKTHPHVFFPEYEYSIWVDSNFVVIGDLSKFIKCVGKVPFASNWHPERNSIYREAVACKLKNKDKSDILDKQIEHYKQEGFPDDFGLIETNMIVRKHMDRCCMNLMEDWWTEMIKWSKRDQLSLPYVIWKNGYNMKDMGFICSQIRKCNSVRVVLHASKYSAKY